MPLTQEQINAFTTKAKAAGATDQQIMLSIAKKQAQIAEQERVNAAAESGVLTPEKAFEAGADINAIKALKENQAKSAKEPLLTAIQDLLARDTAPITGVL